MNKGLSYFLIFLAFGVIVFIVSFLWLYEPKFKKFKRMVINFQGTDNEVAAIKKIVKKIVFHYPTKSCGVRFPHKICSECKKKNKCELTWNLNQLKKGIDFQPWETKERIIKIKEGFLKNDDGGEVK